MESNIFTQLASGSDPLVAVLSFSVLALATVIVVQWRYTTTKTVPKWVWDSQVKELKQIVDLVKKQDILLESFTKK